MTTPCNKDKISQILLNNAQINKVEFDKKEFTPTNRGHGLYVKTEGNDTLIDLRMAFKKPFLGHTHPILIHHNYQQLENKLLPNNYSVPKTEFTKMIETFQKVHFEDVLKEDFKITYHNVVITIDEKILNHNPEEVKRQIFSFLEQNSETFFWIIEQDINLINKDSHLFFFHNIIENKKMESHVHLCMDLHFISSIYIFSHHLFSEDDNIQFFLSVKKLIEQIIAPTEGKNSKDFSTIDHFLDSEHLPIKRIGRYLKIPKKVDNQKLLNNGIISTHDFHPEITFLNIPLSCTKEELLDTLNRIKKSI
ncbi:MAG: hypothetical protein QF441_14485 [Bacteriovoracaceae bacterium]|jgi:hypothetical protein|nr:hypothetical protein [Bacteriovoracaceae bacterium]